MTWTGIPEATREWLDFIGFEPTPRSSQPWANGYVVGDYGPERITLDPSELRELAAALVEAALWLEERQQS